MLSFPVSPFLLLFDARIPLSQQDDSLKYRMERERRSEEIVNNSLMAEGIVSAITVVPVIVVAGAIARAVARIGVGPRTKEIIRNRIIKLKKI